MLMDMTWRTTADILRDAEARLVLPARLPLVFCLPARRPGRHPDAQRLKAPCLLPDGKQPLPWSSITYPSGAPAASGQGGAATHAAVLLSAWPGPAPHLQAINKAAGSTGAELTPQDVALAASQQGRTQLQPPPLQELHALARRVNAQPLVGPSDKQHGIKLPTGGCAAGCLCLLASPAWTLARAALPRRCPALQALLPLVRPLRHWCSLPLLAPGGAAVPLLQPAGLLGLQAVA